jgi:tetratricopeptide (TPR) repeat protein
MGPQGVFYICNPMRKLFFQQNIPGTLLLLISLFALSECAQKNEKRSAYEFLYPEAYTLFPADMAAPTFRWIGESGLPWEISISDEQGKVVHRGKSNISQWKPDASIWEEIKILGKGQQLYFSLSNGTSIPFSISGDSVAAPVFFRTVPLPFKFARENLKKINWHLGSVSAQEQAPVVLGNIPVCGNCHSFSLDGQYLAMDVDARDEKGAYIVSPLEEQTRLGQDQMINWSDAQNGEFTYGLLSQISPDGRYLVSTLKDCEIFVDRDNLEYSQLFFPFKGILQIYDRKEKRYYELPGANDTMLVQSNPVWSPDGKYIYFARTEAAHYEESGITHGSKPSNHQVYNKFLESCLERERLFKFDIYRIPFNEGKGGRAEPLEGASRNGMSNYFPRLSPDGRWLIFSQAESFMLLQKDSRLHIIPAEGGTARELSCNSDNMNSWHSWSPNSKWLVFASKKDSPFTRLYLTHIDPEGNSSPAILLENMSFEKRAVNIPEFVNIDPGKKLEVFPDFLEQEAFKLRMGQIRNKEGLLNEAIEIFNEILLEDPDNAEAFHGRGEVKVKMGDLSAALSDYNSAIGLNPRVPDYYLSRGIARGQLQNFEQAFNDFNSAIELDPLSFMAYNDRAVLKVRQGKVEEGLKDYKRAIELNPAAAMSYVNRGAARAMLGEHSSAMEDFNMAISKDPSLIMAYISRSMLREEAGELEPAMEDIERALYIDPKHPLALRLKKRLLSRLQAN